MTRFLRGRNPSKQSSNWLLSSSFFLLFFFLEYLRPRPKLTGTTQINSASSSSSSFSSTHWHSFSSSRQDERRTDQPTFLLCLRCAKMRPVLLPHLKFAEVEHQKCHFFSARPHFFQETHYIRRRRRGHASKPVWEYSSPLRKKKVAINFNGLVGNAREPSQPASLPRKVRYSQAHQQRRKSSHSCLTCHDSGRCQYHLLVLGADTPALYISLFYGTVCNHQVQVGRYVYS